MGKSGYNVNMTDTINRDAKIQGDEFRSKTMFAPL